MSSVSEVSTPGKNSESVVTKDTRASMFGSKSLGNALEHVSTNGAHMVTALLKWPLP